MKKTYTTYIAVSYNSDGGSPTEVHKRIVALGWTPVFGEYDYKFTWDPGTRYVWTKDKKLKKIDWNKNIENFVKFIDNLHEVLRGLNVRYTIRTVETGKEDFFVVETF
jgi:hypothetical protein